MAEIEDGDLDLADYRKAKKFHWKKFWKKLSKAQANGVVLEVSPGAGAAVVPVPPVPPPQFAASVSAPQPVAKFIGGYSERDSTRPRTFLSPVTGIYRSPTLALADSFVHAGFKSLAGSSYVAEQFRKANWDSLFAKYGKAGLTPVMAEHINSYTQESGFYSAVNSSLRADERAKLKPFFPWLKSFLGGLYCLPLQPGTVMRGVKLDLHDSFEVGKEVVWWSITSTTEKVGVLQNEQFLGKTGPRTMFIITARSLVSIKDFSSMPEDELILIPSTVLQVVAVYSGGAGLTIVQMKEKEPFVPLLDYIHPDLLLHKTADTKGMQAAEKKIATTGVPCVVGAAAATTTNSEVVWAVLI